MEFKRITTYAFIILSFYFNLKAETSLIAQAENNKKDTIFDYVERLPYYLHDSAIDLLEQKYAFYSGRQDTLNMIHCLLGVIDIHLEDLYHNKAFDVIWKALPLAEEFGDKKINMQINKFLGILYDAFYKKNESEKHFMKSLELSKQLASKDLIEKSHLVSAYFNLILHHTKYKSFDKVNAYLDTTYQFAHSINLHPFNMAYLDAEKGNVLIKEGKYKDAEELLLSAKIPFEKLQNDTLKTESGAGYLVFVYDYLGDLYQARNNTSKAIHYFKKAIKISKTYNAHIFRRVETHLKLSKLFKNNKNHYKAYQHLKISKIEGDSLFGSRSHNIKEFIDISNKYNEKIKAQNLEIERKKIQLLKKERKYIYTVVAIIFTILCLIAAGLTIRNIRQKRKHLYKQLKSEKQLKARNKELTSYTLQFIEKQKSISELVAILKKEVQKPDNYSSLIEQAEKDNKNHWEAFNTFFIEVNKKFYETLKTKYSDLTDSDLKLCALMKLNFSTKEISHILGISPSSANMARYRLRKKMGLAKDDSLNDVVASIA